MSQDAGRKGVETKEVCYLSIFVFHNEGLDDPLARQEEMSEFIGGLELDVHLELGQVFVQLLEDLWDVLLLKWSEPWDAGLIWELVTLDESSHWGLGWETGETNLDKLLGVEGSVPVSGDSDWGWDNNTSCVDGLPHVASVDSSCDLLDQNWSQSFGSQRFVNTQEVDLSLHKFLSSSIDVDWNTGDEAEKLILLSTSNSEQPIFLVAWWSQGPLQELDRVVEPEHVVVVFNIVLSEKIIHFFALLVVFDVDVAPLETGWNLKWVSSDLINGLDSIDLLVEVIIGWLIGALWHWLTIPEIMGVVEWCDPVQSFLLHVVGLLACQHL